MSAPFVTGVTALLVSQPEGASLDAIELRNALTESARRDAHTADVPNKDWGYGKLDAVEALQAIDAEPVTPTVRPTERVTETPPRKPTATPPPRHRVFLPKLWNLVP
jgi:hypothetical protein